MGGLSVSAMSFVLWIDLGVKFSKYWRHGCVWFSAVVLSQHLRKNSKLFVDMCFYMVRIIFLQRSRLAARRVIQGSRRDYVPEVRFPRGLVDEPTANMSLGGTAVLDCLRWSCFSMRGFFSALTISFVLWRGWGVTFLKLLVSCVFWFPAVFASEILRKLFNIGCGHIFLHGAKHSLAVKPSTGPMGDPGASPGLCSASSVFHRVRWRTDFKQKFRWHRRGWFFSLSAFFDTSVSAWTVPFVLWSKLVEIWWLSFWKCWCHVLFRCPAVVVSQIRRELFKIVFWNIFLHCATRSFAARPFTSSKGDPEGWGYVPEVRFSGGTVTNRFQIWV